MLMSASNLLPCVDFASARIGTSIGAHLRQSVEIVVPCRARIGLESRIRTTTCRFPDPPSLANKAPFEHDSWEHRDLVE